MVNPAQKGKDLLHTVFIVTVCGISGEEERVKIPCYRGKTHSTYGYISIEIYGPIYS